MTYKSIRERYSTKKSAHRSLVRRLLPFAMFVGGIYALVLLWQSAGSLPSGVRVVAESMADQQQSMTGESEQARYQKVFGPAATIILNPNARVMAIGHRKQGRPGPTEIAKGEAQLWVELPAGWDGMTTEQRSAWKLQQYKKFFGAVEQWEGRY